MKYVLLLFLVVVCFVSYAQTESPEQQLIKLEDQRLKAIVNKDSAFLYSIYDEKYEGVLNTGRTINRTEVVRFQISNNRFINIKIEDVKATIYGNVGITTGRQVNQAKSGSVLGQSKFIRVYVKSGNTWKIINSQGTLIISEGM